MQVATVTQQTRESSSSTSSAEEERPWLEAEQGGSTAHKASKWKLKQQQSCVASVPTAQ